MARDWALFLHLCGVLLFVGGSIAVTALRLLAIGPERPSVSAVLLRAVRPLGSASPAPSPAGSTGRRASWPSAKRPPSAIGRPRSSRGASATRSP